MDSEPKVDASAAAVMEDCSSDGDLQSKKNCERQSFKPDTEPLGGNTVENGCDTACGNSTLLQDKEKVITAWHSLS